MILIVRESDHPILIGDKNLSIDLTEYQRRVATVSSHSIKPVPDKRRKSHIVGQIGHLLMVDLLINTGWKILGHSLGRGTSPLVQEDPVDFIEREAELTVSEEQKNFLRRETCGLPGLRSVGDLLIAKKGIFVIVEVKSSMKDTNAFYLSINEYITYNEACKFRIPVKFALIKFLEKIYI